MSRTDPVFSDIDVVGFHPLRTGPDRVMVVSCKSWQSGFDATHILAQLRGEEADTRRLMELHLRELWQPRWADGFRQKILELTGSSSFTYCLAVTSLSGDAAAWASDPLIQKNLCGNPFGFLTLDQMWGEVLNKLASTPAASEMGRLAQMLKAAGLTHAKQLTALPVESPDGDAGALKSTGQGVRITL